MKTRASLKCFLNDCLWKQIFASNSTQISSDLLSLGILVTPMPLTEFHLKFEELSAQKMLKFALLGNCFSDVFTLV